MWVKFQWSVELNSVESVTGNEEFKLFNVKTSDTHLKPLIITEKAANSFLTQI